MDARNKAARAPIGASFPRFDRFTVHSCQETEVCPCRSI
jgi:hypothetical protein